MKRILLLIFCCFFGFQAFSQQQISFTWSGKPGKPGNTSTRYFTISSTAGYTVDWGDGSTNSGSQIHTYTTAAEYTVTITANGNSVFTQLSLAGNGIISINIGGVLHDVYQKFTSLDVSKASLLENLICSSDSLPSLDLTKNTGLQYLDCSGGKLTSLDLSKNTLLKTLYCSNNQFTSLDLSKNTVLKDLYCSNNKLTALDLSKNTALQNFVCSRNLFTSLDISANTSLKSFNCSNNKITSLTVNSQLEDFNCSQNKIATLDLTNNTALKQLNCSENNLTALNLSQNSALEKVNCYTNQLTSLTLGNNTVLKELYCFENSLTTLDVTKNTALQTLSSGRNRLTSLNVNQNTALKTFLCYENQLTALDVSQNAALELLSCGSNYLTLLDINNNANLKEIYCFNNMLSLENLYAISQKMVSSNNKYLGAQSLPATNTQLNVAHTLTGTIGGINTVYTITKKNGTAVAGTDYELTNNSIQFKTAGIYKVVMTNEAIVSAPTQPAKLIGTYIIGFYPIQQITLSGNILSIPYGFNTILGLKAEDENTPIEVNWGDGQITKHVASKAIDLAHEYEQEGNYTITVSMQNSYGSFSEFSCTQLGVSSLDVSKAPSLKTLFCYENKLTSLDVSNNTALESLTCFSNRLTSIDVTKNTNLKDFFCSYNDIATLDVSKNTKLEYFGCYYTQLTSLDVSKNTALLFLGCHDSKLTALDLSKNTALEQLDCSNNAIPLADIYAISQKISDVNQKSLGTQTLASVKVNTNTAVVVDPVFNGSNTVFVVRKSGSIASANFYTLSGGNITFIAEGNYTVEISNPAITSHTDYPAKVMAAFQVGNVVADISVTGVLVKDNTTLLVGSTEQLSAAVSPSNATNKNVSWSSVNTAIATVSNSGLVTAVANGQTYIVATTADGNFKDSCLVHVRTTAINATGVTLNKTELVLNIGNTEQLLATVVPDSATNQNVSWSSSNTAIATVNNAGLVTAISQGEATISAITQDGEHTATCALTVNKTTGVENTSATEVALKLYPSPVLEQLTIESPEAISQVAFYNTSGQLVKTVLPASNTNKLSIHTASLPSGVYTVYVYLKNSVQIRKVIVLFS